MDTALVVTYAVLWLVVIVVVLVLLVVLRDLALVKLRLGPEPGALAINDGPKIGENVPPLRGALLGGGDVDMAESRPALLLFVSAHCDPCLRLLSELAAFARNPRTFNVYLICQGTRAEVEALAKLFKIEVPIVIDHDGGITQDAFGVHATPFGIAIDESGIVRSKGIANHQEQLEALVRFQITPQGGRKLMPVGPASSPSLSGK